MRALHINFSDTQGGASVAAWRTHRALREIGVDSLMAVLDKQSSSEHVYPLLQSRSHQRWSTFQDKAERGLAKALGLRGKAACGRHGGWIPSLTAERINSFEADIVHLHWINHGVISVPELLQIQAPIVWTLHDMWPFSCGYNYLGSFQNDPIGLSQYQQSFFGSLNLRLKRQSIHRKDIRFIAPSQWIASELLESELAPSSNISIIPNGLDVDQFSCHPNKKEQFRNELGLPTGRKLILAGAVGLNADRRKGFDLLLQSLNVIQNSTAFSTKPALVVFGNDESIHKFDFSGIDVFALGKISNEEDLIKLYNGCDCFALPSREDNLPNVILESFACGLPCVGFRVGGVQEMIKHRVNGYLASPFDPEEFANGIIEAMNATGWKPAARQEALLKYSDTNHANQVSELYRSIAATPRNRFPKRQLLKAA
mgnify:CR=1 FL=1|tara:strand:+ start:6717 stop:7997 length:1281 start_codon:yes stop_codon:yes gene_type:complete